MVQMQGGNDVDYPTVISTLLPTQQMRRYRALRRAARCRPANTFIRT